MATLVQLLERGALKKLDPQLAPGEQEFRLLYAGERLVTWITVTLPTLGSCWNIEQAPIEQLDAFMEVFASDEPLYYERAFRPIRHIAVGIWEIKTADVRIFGWFPKRDHFIGVAGDTTQRVKDYNLYTGYAGEVERFRDGLDLDEPKYVPGDQPDAVVSNFSYPF
ncbi:MAG: hypothetical protein KJ587_04355 [Alphaproteobacteria bacterium]|nr:hypothetical protein [Alphaproteobacteria bacterium]